MSKVAGKLYMYPGHSRWNRLQAVAAACDVEFNHVKGFGARNAMTVSNKKPGITQITAHNGMEDPDFLSKFPLGMVLAFESADGKAHITECSAITDYLATTNPASGLMPTDPGQAGEVRNWLFICESEIIAPLTVINRGHAGIVPYDQKMVDGIFEALHRRMTNINNWVVKRTYLVGDHLTLADITLASTLGHGYAKFFDQIWRDKYPEAFGYFQRIVKEPSLKGAFGNPTLMDRTPEYKPKEE